MLPQAKLAPKLAQLKALEQKQALLEQGLAQYAENDPERINMLSKPTSAPMAISWPCARGLCIASAWSQACVAPAAAVMLRLLGCPAEIGSVTAKDWANTWLGEAYNL